MSTQHTQEISPWLRKACDRRDSWQDVHACALFVDAFSRLHELPELFSPMHIEEDWRDESSHTAYIWYSGRRIRIKVFGTREAAEKHGAEHRDLLCLFLYPGTLPAGVRDLTFKCVRAWSK